MNTYNIDFDICAAIISAFSIFCVFTQKKIQKSQNKVFLITVIINLVSSILDILTVIANSHTDIFSYSVRYLFDNSYLFIHNLLPICLACYVIAVFELYHSRRKIERVLFFLPIACNIILFILNPVFHCIFYYNSENLYTHGSLFLLLYISGFIYIIFSTIRIILGSPAVSIQKRISMLMFVIASIIAVIFQVIYPYILIEQFVESLTFFGMLIAIENEDEIRNPITGIYNRKSFLTDAGLMLENKKPCGIIVIQLPDLNYYNTTVGIEAVNNITKTIAQFLFSLNSFKRVYDCENGRFVLMYYNMLRTAYLTDSIQQRFESQWTYNSISVKLSLQMRFVSIPSAADSLGKLLLVIDAPSNKVDNNIEVINEETFKPYRRKIEIEYAVEKAILNKSFQVYYQPIWSSKDNKIHSAEALVRLFDENLGGISPDEFIPLAEKNGTIVQIGRFVFEESCRFYTENHLDKGGIDYLEVNLSVVQCMNKNIVQEFSSILKKYKLDPSHINLEITESAFANSTKLLQSTIDSLHKIGFTFSMDDYGTGYSNFSYMSDMPFRIVKIDKSLLWNTDKNERAMIMLKNNIRMIKEMNLEIVVEGVETKGQKTLLEKLKCEFCQGYYFSKPVESLTFLKFCKYFNSNKI